MLKNRLFSKAVNLYRTVAAISTAKLLATLCMVLFCTSVVLGQTLTFSTPPTEYSSIQIGGQLNGLGGVGATMWNNVLYVAYTDNSGDGNLWLISSTNGSTFSSPTQIPIGGVGGGYASNSNPSLAVYNGLLYVAYIDIYGDALYASVTLSASGYQFSNWTYALSTIATDSPSLAAFNGSLYLAVRAYAAANNDLWVCNLTTNQCPQFPKITLGDSPALGVFNGTLYVGYRDTSSSHYIYLAESTTGSAFNVSTAATGSHTSTAVSFAVHNNILYILFRQNSSGDRIYYTYSTNGSTFSSPVEVSITMGGPPAAVNAVFNCCSSLSGDLFDVFRQNDTGHYMFTTHAP